MRNLVILLVFVALIAFSSCKPLIDGDEKFLQIATNEVSSIPSLDEFRTARDASDSFEMPGIGNFAQNSLGASENLSNFSWFLQSNLHFSFSVSSFHTKWSISCLECHENHVHHDAEIVQRADITVIVKLKSLHVNCALNCSMLIGEL